MAKHTIKITNDFGGSITLRGVDDAGRYALEQGQFRSTGSVVVHDNRGRHDIACSRIYDVRVTEER
ncbi:hypothetical protein [Micromonospora cathayae]|uniref:Uncharacterized protein n=1 Tax=Micromonospora cathayae TaxID=3028804 RepID=A0ABY7ZVX0_9ACTN|nr:hypothetical protein [Micromonospora sp. HUAS 3]WDZ87167.1 hypothetical protein PVK37_12565 [Micromonospora sp. HUAS 3]